jgi:bacteriochlorophyll/chlorophyll synthetase
MSLELSNPAGWLLPMAAFFCGAVASGQIVPDTTHAIRLGLGLVLAGPFLAGMNSVVNSLFDRDLDAINHPERPLPSGRLSVNSVIAQMWLMGMLVTLYAHMLENGLGTRLDAVLGLGGGEQRGVFYLTIASLALIFAVNAPPLSLRRNTWWSGIFFGILAVALPWLTGHLLFGPLSFISTVFAICFAFGAVGLLILAALNNVEGERRVGIRSLSALLGREMGILIAAMLIDTAILAAAILAAPQNLPSVFALVGLCLLQVGLQVAFFRRPSMPTWVQVTAAGVFVGAMVTAAATLPGVSAALALL